MPDPVCIECVMIHLVGCQQPETQTTLNLLTVMTSESAEAVSDCTVVLCELLVVRSPSSRIIVMITDSVRFICTWVWSHWR